MSFETVSPPTVMSEEAINRFYGSDDISARIIDALRTAGKDLDALTREDLSKFDEFHPGGRGATRALAEIAGLQEGMEVLDLGCGVGGPARTLAGEFGCRVTGLDITETFCRAAEMLNRLVGMSDQIRVEQGDAADLRFAGYIVRSGVVPIRDAERGA